MNWFETRPLFGQTIVVTRTRQQASDLRSSWKSSAPDVIEAPTIEIAPPADPSHVDAALARLHEYDWIIFTSANGVTETKRKLDAIRPRRPRLRQSEDRRDRRRDGGCGPRSTCA